MDTTSTPPCIIFSQLDVTSPWEIAMFAEHLYDTTPDFQEEPLPEGEPNESFHERMQRIADGQDSFHQKRWADWNAAFARDREANPWKWTEDEWWFQAPRRRMLKLLLTGLGQYSAEHSFESRFTMSLDCLAEDARDCARILPPIQEKLKWVLEGFLQRQTHEFETKWCQTVGEYWWLPQDQANYVREQLKKTRLDLAEQLSPQFGILYERIDQHKLYCEEAIRNQAIADNAPDPESKKMWSEMAKSDWEIAKRYEASALAAKAELNLYKMDENVYALSQRFDIVPSDFEAALYVDFVEFLRRGGSVLPCSHCKLALSANPRQQARGRKGQPVYHSHCHAKQRAESKRITYKNRSQDPDFRQQENARVKNYRSETSKKKPSKSLERRS